MQEQQPSSHAPITPIERRGIPADEWHVCSRIFTEGRRMRVLASELRGLLNVDTSPASRHALERYVAALDAASALGDITADELVRRRGHDLA